MALQQQLQHTPLSSNEGRFVHLEAIDVELTGTCPYPKLKIKLEDESHFHYKSEEFEDSLSMHWNCDIYVKSGSKAVLSIQYIKGLRSQRTVDKIDVDFGSDEFESGRSIRLTGQESVATTKLLIGEPKSDLDVARLLAPRTVTALGLKVAMLDKLDRILQICDLVLRLGVGASEMNPYAKVAASIVSTVFERFRNIPSFHNELVLIMEEVVDLLPIMELILRRITDKEVQDIVQKFFEFVVVLSNNLKDYASKPPLKFILRNWYEPRRDEIQQVKARLTAMTQSLNLGLQVNILGIATSIHEHQLTETENKALKCCRPPENSAYDPSRGCLAGTRTSVLQNVERWVHSTDHRQRLYWIHGVAGCGKSSVAASVADALEKRTILSGSFFCKRDIPQRRSAARLVRSLVYFLAQRVFAFKNAVLQHLVDDPDIADKPLSYQFNTLLVKPLAAVPRETDSVSMVIIVIDALDECEDSEIVASYLASAVQVAPWIRLIVTSRPSPRIRENILRKEDLVQECDLFRVTTDEDIRLFAQDQFTSNPDLRNILLIPIDALVRKAAGHFIWISTVLKHVGMEPFGKSRLLQRIIDSDPRTSSSEGNLDAIYSRVLEDASQGSTSREHAVKLVVGLIFVISKNRPLPSKAIRAFIPSELDAGQDELDALFRHLGSVLYEDNRTRAVRVCHPSFLDFVGSMVRSGRFWTAVKELETNMTEKCLQILLDDLKFNICHLETSYYANSSVLDLSYRIDRDIPQHLQYSCLYWLNHMCRSQNSETCKVRMQQLLHEFLYRPSALYWLEALSVLSEIRVAFTTLRELARVLKHSGADEDLVSMATDLFRFVGAFREPMVISAPHVYLSALLWAPVKSTVASCYSESFDSQQCILKGVNDYWPANLHTISAQSGVLCVAYSPDGRRISAGLYDKTVLIWDAETGAQVGTPFQGHQDSVYSVAYSPDGRYIISGSSDKTVRVWHAETGTQVGRPLEGHRDRVYSVAYSPDGRYIVSGSGDETMYIWDVEAGAQAGILLEGHEGSVLSVAYSPDGRYIASGSSDATVRIWDALTGAQVGTPLEGHQESVWSVAYSPDGQYIISGSWDRTVRIWDAETGAQVGRPLECHGGPIMCVSYSPDGLHIASGALDGTVRILDAKTGVQVDRPLIYQHRVLSVAYSPDGRHIVSGSDDKTMCIWDSRIGAQAGMPLEGHLVAVSSIAYSPDGRYIVSGSWDTTLCIWAADTGIQMGLPLEGHENAVRSVAYSPDGRHIASGSDDETVRIWDALTGDQVCTPLEGHDGSVESVAYSPDGRYIASASLDSTVRVWHAETGTQVGRPLEGHQDPVCSVAYSPDGRYIVSGSKDETMRIWDAETGAQVGKVLEGHESPVWCVAYLPDGRHIVSGSWDKTVRIWDALTGAQVGTPIEGHDEYVSAVACLPDGRHIVSGSEDKTVRIWDALTGKQVGTPLKGHHGLAVSSIICSPDGRHIASAGLDDKTVRIWDTESAIRNGSRNNTGGSRDAYCFKDDGVICIAEHTAGTPTTMSTTYSKYPPIIPSDGWIRTPTGGLFLWIPHEYRNGICDTSVRCIPDNAPGRPVRIDWKRMCHGESWTNVKIC